MPNPCNQVTCGSGQECKTDKQGRASCGCPDFCEPIIRPVCASDRKTYKNLCEMNKQGCKRQTHLTVKYFGTCGKILIFRILLLLVFLFDNVFGLINKDILTFQFYSVYGRLYFINNSLIYFIIHL